MNKIKLIVGASLLLLSVQVNAALLIVDADDGFKLIGVTGVFVNVGPSERDASGFYDVSFVDGTCAELFNGCDEPTDFTFQDWSGAIFASLALMGPVSGNDSTNPFDIGPGVTRGCEFTSEPRVCVMLTPYWFYNDEDVSARRIDHYNYITDCANEPTCQDFDEVLEWGDFFINPNRDTSDSSRHTWAIWSKSSTVPAPPAIWLFGTGLIGLIGFTKLRKAA